MLTVHRRQAADPAADAQPEPKAQVRPCTPDDLDQVASLFRKTFPRRPLAGSGPLDRYLADILFAHPWRDPELNSLVYVDGRGAVGGFIAVFPIRMQFRGEPIRAAASGSLMVENHAENPLAGARLLRAFLGGPQQLSFSESANAVSRPMWDRLGGRTAPNYSMEWLRVLKPAGFAAALGTDRSPALGFLRPAASLLDRLNPGSRSDHLRVPPPNLQASGEAVEADAVIDLMPRLSARYALHPDWGDAASLAWFLGHAASKERYGPLRCRVVRDRKGETAGLYLYCARPRGIGFVLQILARPNAAEAVVDDLIRDAAGLGTVALRGRVQPELADILLRGGAIFLHSASMVVHSRRSDLVDAIAAGDALITGLAGESWARLIGGTFR